MIIQEEIFVLDELGMGSSGKVIDTKLEYQGLVQREVQQKL